MTGRAADRPGAGVDRVVVRADYLYWAHEPAAEDGHAPAEALLRRWDNAPRKRNGYAVGYLEIPADAIAELEELRQVAEIYAIAQDDDDRAMRREARSVLAQLQTLKLAGRS